MADHFKKRIESFQKNPEASKVRRKYEESTMKLRKLKRNEAVQKKRNKDNTDDDPLKYKFYLGIVPDELMGMFPELQGAESEIEKLKVYANILVYPEIPEYLILEVLKILTDCLSGTVKEDPREIFVEFGILDILCAIILENCDNEVIAQAIWCLNNLLAGQFNYSEEVAKTGVVPRLIQLLKLNDTVILENIAYVFGNLIIENIAICQEVLNSPYLSLISSLEYSSTSLVHSIVFSLSSIAHHSALLSLVNIAGILKLLDDFYSQDQSTCISCFINLTKSNGPVLGLALESNIAKQLIQGLKGSNQFCKLSLLAIGNLSNGKIEQENFLLNEKILDVFYEVLKKVDQECCKNIYWILGNLALGAPTTRFLVSNHQISMEFEYALHHYNNAVRLEASIFYKNLLMYACVEVKNKFIEGGMFSAICENFLHFDVEIVNNCLTISGYLLGTEKYTGEPVGKLFEETGCLDFVERIGYSQCVEVARPAKDLINMYFV